MKKHLKIGIIVITFLAGFTAYNFLSDSKYHAWNFVPDSYSFFLYTKDVASLQAEIENSKTFTELETNYFYQDLKIKWTKNMDFFFLQSDFDLKYLLSLIKNDMIIGKSYDRFFLAAALSVKAQMMEKVFRLMPNESIQEISAKSYKFYKINKIGKTFFYMMVNNYLILTDNQSVLEAMANSAAKKTEPLEKEFKDSVSKNDIIVKIKPGSNYNFLNLFPDVSEISIHYLWKKDKFMLSLKSIGDESKIFGSSSGYDFLKFSGYDTPFCYYKSYFNLADLLANIKKTDKGQVKLQEFAAFIEGKAEELLGKIKPGLFAAVNGIGFPSKEDTSKVVVETSLVFQFTDKINASEKQEMTEKLKRSMEYFFGNGKWESVTNQPKKYQYYINNESDTSLMVYDKWLIVSFSKPALDNILAHIDQTNPSVYDKYQSTFAGNLSPTFYLYLNPNSFIEKLEPILRYYTLAQLQMEENEYEKGFGQIIQKIKKMKPYYFSLSYSKQGKKHYGEIKQME